MKKISDSLVEAVWKAGVVGAGGAGFPTWKKIDAQVETVVVNGAECEPLLRNDQQLMARSPAEIINGLRLVMETTGAKEGIIALKKKYKAAIAALDKELQPDDSIRLHLMESVYPAGDEFVIVFETTGKVIPGGEIPLTMGVLVSNVETFYNISLAREGRPVTHRNLTVTGAVREPTTLRLPIGTPLIMALDLAGGPMIDNWTVISGGPMMGEVIDDPDHPVTKTTSSFIVLPRDHPVVTRKTRDLQFDLSVIQSTCCECTYCTLICPRALIGHNFKPHLVMQSLALGMPLPDSPGLSSAPYCCACDLCGVYSCPMALAIGRLNKEVSGRMEDWNWKPVPADPTPVPSPLREYSLVPVSRLTKRLNLGEYDRPAPFSDPDFHPGRVRIPLKQHIGAGAEPVVKKGDKIAEGELIGDIESGTMGARIHASITGTIEEVTEAEIIIRAA